MYLLTYSPEPLFFKSLRYLILFQDFFVFFSMNMIYTIKIRRKILRKINYKQRNLDDKRSARH